MDVSRYDFGCQKAFYQGLKFTKSYGHSALEVEHVALALLSSHVLEMSEPEERQFILLLEQHLAKMPKILKITKIEFGIRLNAVLDKLEDKFKNEKISEPALWKCLLEQSTVLRNFILSEKTPQDSAPSSIGVNQSDESSDNSLNQEKNGVKMDKKIQQYTTDLTAKAQLNELDPVIGRDGEIRRVLEILGRKKKNNPLLIGEPGVGKSAIAEGIAIRISGGRVPEPMKNKRLLSLDLGQMLAGTKFRGEFEDRLKSFLKAVEAHADELILFIDEIHMLIGAGNPEGGMDAANMLKPILANGKLHCLGATTIEEYKKYIEKDPALERRFQPIFLEEPDKIAALSILRGIKKRYEIHHGVQISDDALNTAIDLSLKYIPERRLPDKAIDLIDEACSRLRLQINSIPSQMDELRTKIESLEIERKSIPPKPENEKALIQIDVRLSKTKQEYLKIEKIWKEHQHLLDQLRDIESKKQETKNLFEESKSQSNYDFAARLQYGEMPRLCSEHKRVRDQLIKMRRHYPFLRQSVGNHEIAEVVAQWTRIPVGKLLENEAEKLLTMEDRLKKRIFGQDRAVFLVSQAIKRARVGINDSRRPLGVFLFLGPTGVGKTETAKALAEELFNDETRLVRIDMTEFMEQHSVARLFGAPPGYIGHDEGGKLTESVRLQSYSVVLFDEIEKAHPRVLDVLLQLFDDGRLTDGKGKTVNFKNTLIILTSNVKIDIPANVILDDQQLRHLLLNEFKPEFVNRLDEIASFRLLSKKDYEKLFYRQLSELNERLSSRQFRVVVGQNLKNYILDKCQNSQFGGRALKRAFQNMVIDEVSNRILTHPYLIKGAWVIDFSVDQDFVWYEENARGFYLPPARSG